MKQRIFLMSLVFLILGSGDLLAQVIVDQPCRFNHSYELVNDHRSHWDDPHLHESRIALDLGANGRKPLGFNGEAMTYQTCQGSDALASISGIVRRVQLNGWFECGVSGIGWTRNSEVIIEGDNGVFVSYLHMDINAPNTVQVGQRVNVGDVIGTIAAVGCSSPTFPHIHFRVFQGGLKTRDPDHRLSHDQWRFGPLQANEDPEPDFDQANRDKALELRARDVKRGDIEMCIDVPGADFFEGNQLQLWECNGFQAQKFVYEHDSGLIKLAADPYFCIDIPNSDIFKGASLQLWKCNYTEAQRFTYDSYTNLIHVRANPSFCIDIVNLENHNGAGLQLFRCQPGHAAQSFYLAQGMKIQSILDGVLDQDMCLDVFNADFYNERGGERDGDIQLYSCHRGQSAQHFAYEHWNGMIRARDHPSICLDVLHSNFSDGAQLQVHSCNDTNAQKFYYYHETQQIKPWANPNYCFDLEGGSNADHTRAQLWWCHHGDNQKFHFADY